MRRPHQKYQVLPLPIVEKAAKKILTDEERRAASNIAEQLENYPSVQHLDLDKCGEGIRIAFRSPEISKHGWLRGIFWIDDKERTIYFIDLFWKKNEQDRAGRRNARKSSYPSVASRAGQGKQTVVESCLTKVGVKCPRPTL